MGEIYESKYSSDETLKPGIYRIFNVHTGSAIQVSDHDPTKIVAWEQHSRENQQWFLQRSGHGYQLRNKLRDAYLAVSSTDNHGLVYASRYPTTWVFLKFGGNYVIQLADRNRVLDLHHCSGHNGNEIHTWELGGINIPHKVWALDRLGGDPEAKPQERFTNKSEELLRFQDELSNTRQELSSTRQEFAEFRSALHQCNENIRQLQQDLKLFTCGPPFSLGPAITYGYSIVTITVVLLLSLPLYRFLRRLFWRALYVLSSPATHAR
ncbi:hypothetical protein ACGC1H_000931 [Rhizoctonia solani]|uniref:Ricin B lectin domain-containing protein n=1 Tax=Rhizoctonia solani TaxID=456999 RepID=A0A8H2XJM8_9AGAM|nr:unnamed protein product [Rhizoctonia solani]